MELKFSYGDTKITVESESVASCWNVMSEFAYIKLVLENSPYDDIGWLAGDIKDRKKKDEELKTGEDYRKTLKVARHKAGLNQRQLAAAIGVSQTSLSSYEVGRMKPSVKTAWKLSKRLGVDFSGWCR